MLVGLNWTLSAQQALVRLGRASGLLEPWEKLLSQRSRRASANPVPCLLHAEVPVSVSKWERRRHTLWSH